MKLQPGDYVKREGHAQAIQEGTDVVINKGRFYLVTTRELLPEEVAEAIKANL